MCSFVYAHASTELPTFHTESTGLNPSTIKPPQQQHMASLSPLSLPQHLTISASKLPKTHTKPTLILCRSTTQEQHYAHHTASVSDTHFSDSVPGPDGTGAAAPTRGQIFLERHRSLEAAKLVAEENSTSKKKKTKKEKPLKVSTAVASCYGCGAPLQTLDSDAPGYVDSQTYELKKKHRQLRTVLCGRCRLLSHGHMITAVGGNGGYPGGKQFVTAEQLREKLSHLRHEKVLIVKLVDIVDFNGSFLARVRDLAGANPIILVVTKVDLLPKGTDLNSVGDWVVEATTKKKLNVLSVHLTSSKSLVGIVGVESEIQKEKKGRDVYILGAANVGKSAFINALLKMMAQKDPAAAAAQKYKPIQSAVPGTTLGPIQINAFLGGGGAANVGKSAFINALLKMMAQKDPAAAAAQKYKPIQSAVPGTTLGPIQINAFLGGGKIFDTPGVHLHHRQAAVVHSDDLSVLAPQSRLRGHSVVVALDNGTASKVKSNGLNGFSIFWGGLVRIDILQVLPETCLTFYGPKALQIHMVPTDKADEFYQKEVGVLLVPPTRKERADDWRGLEIERQLHISFKDVERPACDVAISGLGWISVEPVSKSIRISDPNLEKTAGELHLTVHVPKPVEIFVRPPMPVAKAGAEWYQYRELTEKEEEARPKCYF